MLKPSLEPAKLAEYISKQLISFFPDEETIDQQVLKRSIENSLKRFYICCSGIKRKYYSDGDIVLYNHLNSDQHAMFLYMLSRDLYLNDAISLATKTYYLNKSLHSIDVMYNVELPQNFLFSHCVGTVLGKAEYGNYFQVGQNCTVGNESGVYPVLGEGVALYKGSIVVGDSHIGNDVHISAHTMVRHAKVPNHKIVIGSSPNLIFKNNTRTVKEKFFTVSND